MPYRVAINGYGRIGRCVLRALQESHHHGDLRVVAINEPADLETIAHLTKYDSTHGRFQGTVEVGNDGITINGDTIKLSHSTSLQALPWQAHGVDLVLECSGTFTSRASAMEHLRQGAKRVLFSQPASPDVDATIVYGVNHEELKPSHRIISNASCTTNCIVPIIKSIDETLGVEMAHTTTIHSAMNDQPVIDAYHHTDLRRTRSSSVSIIPVETQLALGIGRIFPHLKERVSSTAMRVPTVNVSMMELSVLVKKPISDVDEVNDLLQQHASKRYHGVLGFTREPLASCDFNHDGRSAIVDGGQTTVTQGRLIKIQAWFDNEWGFANRMLDVAKVISQLDQETD